MADSDSTISRFELIAAGCDFNLIDEKRRSWVYDDSRGKYWHVHFYHAHNMAKILANNDTGKCYEHASFESQSGMEHTRTQVADFIGATAHDDAQALRVSWVPFGYTGWPEPAWAEETNISLDALLYSAAQHANPIAARLYLEAGANPLTYTYDGDCAARVGVANRMINVFDRPEWLNAGTKDTGETGLHWLASRNATALIIDAINLGACLDRRDHHGNRVLDMLDKRADRSGIDQLIAENCARRLRIDLADSGETQGVGCALRKRRRL